MYARSFTFKAKSDVRSEVEALADQAFAFMKTLQGFVSVHFMASEDETVYGTFSLWETKQDAEAGGEAIRAKTKPVLETLVVEPPTVQVFEVYKPRS